MKQFGQKIKDNAILLLMSLLLVRGLVDASVPQAIMFISISSVYCYTKWLKSQAVSSVNEEVKKELEDVKTSLSGLLMRAASKPKEMQQEIKRFF